MNRQFRLYHHGEIEDIGWVVRHALARGRYCYLGMSGFSMGANMTLKYLSVHGERAPAEIIGAAVFSAPCDLAEGAEVLDRPGNWLYKKRFLDRLAEKIRIKDTLFPGRIDVQQLRAVRRWRDFDEWFSAPMCGYENAAAFYRDASPKYFMEGIRVPVLLASALNDPILTPGCMPVELAKNHPFLHLELPTKGGHCGFMIKNSPHSWAELRALEWLGQLI
jgi:predicted alpha/beta-fold hydrolase